MLMPSLLMPFPAGPNFEIMLPLTGHANLFLRYFVTFVRWAADDWVLQPDDFLPLETVDVYKDDDAEVYDAVFMPEGIKSFCPT